MFSISTSGNILRQVGPDFEWAWAPLHYRARCLRTLEIRAKITQKGSAEMGNTFPAACHLAPLLITIDVLPDGLFSNAFTLRNVISIRAPTFSLNFSSTAYVSASVSSSLAIRFTRTAPFLPLSQFTTTASQ